MKILVVSNLYPPDVCGGYELGCQQAVEALRARGHEVLVLTTAGRLPVASEPQVRRSLKLADLWDAYSLEKSVPPALRLQETEALQISAFNVRALTHVLEDFRPDVAYLWMLVGVGGLGLISCLTHLGVPWVWHLMDEVPSKLCTTFYQVRPELVREFSRQFRGSFLACSRQLLDEIASRGFTLGDEVEVIPNWLSGSPPPLRSRFRQPGEPLKIVTAAAAIDRTYDKGIDLLIRAGGHLRESGHSGFSIDIYGRVADPSFANLIRKQGFSTTVRLRGSVPRAELLACYGEYDVFAFPGRVDEPNAFAPLEAMPSGCVPLISRQGGNSEWLIHGVDCLKVPRTAKGFAGALERVIVGEVSLEALARRGAATVRREFQLESLLPRIESALLRASRRSREGAGTADEAYRLALLAEKLSRIFVQAPYLESRTA